MNPTSRPVCKVCHRPLEDGEQYLVSIDGKSTTAVHRSLCFPPARAAQQKPSVPRAA